MAVRSTQDCTFGGDPLRRMRSNRMRREEDVLATLAVMFIATMTPICRHDLESSAVVFFKKILLYDGFCSLYSNDMCCLVRLVVYEQIKLGFFGIE